MAKLAKSFERYLKNIINLAKSDRYEDYKM